MCPENDKRLMNYLIKLDVRGSDREAVIEGPYDMILDDLNIEIKSALGLQCNNELAHCFQINGDVYVPCYNDVLDLWGDEYWLDSAYPRVQDLLDPEEFRLNEVFTVKGSVLIYTQKHIGFRVTVRCTLIDRV